MTAGVVSPSDHELLRRIARRDDAALSSLYDRYAAAALALAVRVVGDRAEAEDVVQDVFVKLWQTSSGGFDPSRGSVAAWLMSSVRNAAIDRLRRKDALRRATEASALQPRPEPEREFPEDLKRVAREVAALPPDQRQAIELAYYDGLTQSQIAERLKVPLGTVKTRMRLGMIKLRAALVGREEAGG
jgi:RNA polymerase sigma-70 factor (ECF subfamily)